ncbi:MAG TPA: PRC-barrel domain-containing protein [Bryobacteraceae bacterium]|nr:PRC-barrel domain-containing protein [Bryobacteraceae bacterium]
MLHPINRLHGYVIEATDGEVGKVDEFYFDDTRWAVRYVVVDTGTWLSGKRSLLPPGALSKPDLTRRVLPVSLTRSQVEESPDIDTDKPITRRHEEELRRHFGWSTYWYADPMLGDPSFPSGPLGMSPAVTAGMARDPQEDGQGDPHLESARDIIGYAIEAVGGEIGHVEDLVVDDQNWVVRYVVASTREWLPGKRVLIAPEWVEKLDWDKARVDVALHREFVQGSPSYDASVPITREDEARLYAHYGKKGYWI